MTQPELRLDGWAKKRNPNFRLWGGFGLAIAATVSYIPIFARWPVTRDFPWVNLLLYAVAGWLLGRGLFLAYSHPSRYRGRVAGVILGLFSLAMCGLFVLGTFVFARRLPSPGTALRVGQSAPEFSLTDSGGHMVSLAQLRQGHRAVLLIFYRGYW